MRLLLLDLAELFRNGYQQMPAYAHQATDGGCYAALYFHAQPRTPDAFVVVPPFALVPTTSQHLPTDLLLLCMFPRRRFEGTLMLRPGSYRVKFLVDGEWRLAADWPTEDDGRGNTVCVLTVA
jgi:hypothetical protein